MTISDTAVAPSEQTSRTALRLTGLAKHYGPVRAVDGIDLTIRRGEIVAMLGPNGAGKSTINEMITGLVRPDTGTVEVFGIDPQHAVRQGMVGAMLQSGALLHDATTLQLLQLMHGLHRHPMPLADVIDLADLSSFAKTKTDKLSGGQAQRLRYALALLPDPDLLILDEPTVGMDVEVRRRFWESMRGFIDGGRTVLFATHYLEEADQVADRIVVIDRGRIVADGTGAKIKSQVIGRTIEVSAAGASLDGWAELPAVTSVEHLGSRIRLHSSDSDRTLRALLTRFPDAADIEIASARLEDAFVALTADHGPAGQVQDQQPTGDPR